MIFDALDQAETRYIQSEVLKKAFRFLCETDLTRYPLGKTNIVGDEIYVNRMTYHTDDAQARIWEAHRRYIDIHVVLAGEENVQVSSLARMTCETAYNPETDAALFQGEADATIRLRPGDFLLCYPEDVHKTGVRLKEEGEVQKLVCKVRL
jgi:YhcH/YjgK/YiaL family protein